MHLHTELVVCSGDSGCMGNIQGLFLFTSDSQKREGKGEELEAGNKLLSRV